MQTRCPTCETIFRFTEAQATAASGMVQCGVCHRFFNSMNNRYDPEQRDNGEEAKKRKDYKYFLDVAEERFEERDFIEVIESYREAFEIMDASSSDFY